ncbi:MAG: hypothetical protein J6A40_08385 [Bacteroides sp.]|nr:hypothetical protein [Bacteroides sp.]
METICIKLVGLGRKWDDFSALDSYLYYFEDDYFCEKVYPDAFDSEILNLVDVDEDVEFSGIEEGCMIEHEFNIGVDKDLLDSVETAKDFYRSYITQINIFELFDTYALVSSFECVNGNVISLV